MMHLLTDLGKWQGLGGSTFQWHESITVNMIQYVFVCFDFAGALIHKCTHEAGEASTTTFHAATASSNRHQTGQNASALNNWILANDWIPRTHFDFLHHMSYIIKLRLCVFIQGSNNTDRPYSALSSNSFPTASRQFSTCIALFRAQTALCKTVACVIPQAFSRPIKRHRGPRLESHLTLVPSGTKRPDALWSWYSFLVYLVKPNLLETWTFCRPANLALARLRASTANWIFSSLAKGMSTKVT